MGFVVVIVVGVLLLVGVWFVCWYWVVFNVGIVGVLVFVIFLIVISIYFFGMFCLWCMFVWLVMILFFWVVIFCNLFVGVWGD